MSMLPCDYISPECKHDFHDYCQYVEDPSRSRILTRTCKYCGTECKCDCHKEKK